MLAESPYALISEMLESPGIMRRFDPDQGADWARVIDEKKRLFLTGEGASRIFPAKNMIDLSLRRNIPWQICTEGARQAAEYDLSRFIVIGASNSGQTKELISLFEKLKREGVTSYGITATADSKLAKIADYSKRLSCGPEKAIAATKSVIEQALVYQSLLRGEEWENKNKAADACEEVLMQVMPPEIIDRLSTAPIIYFSGRNNGVAEELALKANEIAHKKSCYLEGTYALHGIEEVMQKNEVIVLIEPFKEDIEKYREVLVGRTGITIIAIASFDTPFPAIKIPALEGFNAYMQLLAGWNLLVAAALANGINIDKTERARKVGNRI